jgi:hypothetical protein
MPFPVWHPHLKFRSSRRMRAALSTNQHTPLDHATRAVGIRQGLTPLRRTSQRLFVLVRFEISEITIHRIHYISLVSGESGWRVDRESQCDHQSQCEPLAVHSSSSAWQYMQPEWDAAIGKMMAGEIRP